MTQSEVNTIFGIHTITAYNKATHEPFGNARVNAEASITIEGETIPLNGGSSKYPWKVERGLITPEINLTLREYPSFLFGRLLGQDITENSAEASGNASTLTNQKGTSAVQATTGIANVGVKSGSETDVKFGKFIVKVVSPTTVDVYAMHDLDFANGTDKAFEDDNLKVTASALTISTGAAVEIPGFGVELTGGSGTIGMTAGDTAVFETRPINSGSREVTIGQTTDTFTDFGLVLTAGRQGDGSMQELDCFNCSGSGMPINFVENQFSEFSVTLQMYRDTARNGLFTYRDVKASN